MREKARERSSAPLFREQIMMLHGGNRNNQLLKWLFVLVKHSQLFSGFPCAHRTLRWLRHSSNTTCEATHSSFG